MKMLLVFILFSNYLIASTDIAPSVLSRTEGPQNICSDGVMKVIESKTDKVLVLGSQIQFSLSNKSESSVSNDTKCKEDIQRTKLENKYTQITTTTNCSHEYRNLNSIVIEEIIIEAKQVRYIRKEGDRAINCLYKRALK